MAVAFDMMVGLFRWFTIALVAGCGRLSFDPLGTPTSDAVGGADGLLSDGSNGDAPTVCTGPFGPPQLVANVNSTSDEWGGFLTNDRLELYFGSRRTGGAGEADLYVARRSSPGDPLGPPERLTNLSTTADDDNPFVEPDGLTLWFDGGGDLKRSTRVAIGAPWSAPTVFAPLSSSSRDVAPSFSPDGLTIYFSSDRSPAVGDLDVWYARRPSLAAPFEPAQQLAGVNTAVQDCCIQVRSDGTAMWFTTQQLSGANEIAVIGRDPSTGGTIGTPSLDPLVDSAAEEVDMFETLDGTVRGFASSRPGGTGSFDLYSMERACL